MPEHVLLSGIVGSTAYGLAQPGSDIDRLGLFATPAARLLGLKPPKDTISSTSPDITFHEAKKFCLLVLKGNPTVSELLWLDNYEVMTPFGEELVGIRKAFPSARRVRDAYLGYAAHQFRKLEARSGTSFSSDTAKRTAKHARHLRRLLTQGYELYTQGELKVKLDFPQVFFEFGERVSAGDLDFAKRILAQYTWLFDNERTVLPEEPDWGAVEDWLLRVRARI